MVSFRRSPEEAIRRSAKNILSARKYSLWPTDLLSGLFSRKYGSILLGALALYYIGMFLKGADLIEATIRIATFTIVYTAIWCASFTIVKYSLRTEARKPEYDWAVEYSDEE